MPLLWGVLPALPLWLLEEIIWCGRFLGSISGLDKGTDVLKMGFEFVVVGQRLIAGGYG